MMQYATALDPRRHAYRPDIAARALAGLVPAARLVDGMAMACGQAVAPILAQPEDDAPRISDLLLGESFTQYDVRDGWAWGQSVLDGYVGYLKAAALVPQTARASHVVGAPASHAYSAPALKSPAVTWLSYGCRVTIIRVEHGFAEAAELGWIPAKHLRAVGVADNDPVRAALALRGVPYLWGGRSAAGLDCSGLVQLVCQGAGIQCPRDTDMMAAELGSDVADQVDPATACRGDLIFLPGHVVFALGHGTVLHANAGAMAVAIEPLDDLFGRLSAAEGRVTAIRRLPSAA